MAETNDDQSDCSLEIKEIEDEMFQHVTVYESNGSTSSHGPTSHQESDGNCHAGHDSAQGHEGSPNFLSQSNSQSNNIKIFDDRFDILLEQMYELKGQTNAKIRDYLQEVNRLLEELKKHKDSQQQLNLKLKEKESNLKALFL